MKYLLTGLGQYSKEIDYTNFEHLRVAQARLIKARPIEENYMLLLENYGEFEKKLSSLVVDKILSPEHELEDNFSINQKIINFLTAYLLYFDPIREDKDPALCDDASQSKVLGDRIGSNNDSDIIIINSLRNYSQHVGLPFPDIYYRFIECGDGKHRECKISLPIDIQRLEMGLNKHEKNRKAVKRLKSMNKITPNEFVEGLDIIKSAMRDMVVFHEWLRDFIQPNLEMAEKVIQEEINSYENNTKLYRSGQRDGLIAAEVDESEGIIRKIDISENCIKRRKMLQKRNKPIGYFQQKFIIRSN